VKWDEEKLEVSPIDGAVRKFFVRVPQSDESRIKSVFGDVEIMTGVVDGECGFVTSEMSEADYRKKAEQFGNILSMIRVD
jgi:homoserine dehydrogenase